MDGVHDVCMAATALYSGANRCELQSRLVQYTVRKFMAAASAGVFVNPKGGWTQRHRFIANDPTRGQYVP
jgi:hypothetical protein